MSDFDNHNLDNHMMFFPMLLHPFQVMNRDESVMYCLANSSKGYQDPIRLICWYYIDIKSRGYRYIVDAGFH